MTKPDTKLALGNENQFTFMCDKCRHIFPFQKVDADGVTHHVGYIETSGGMICYNCHVVDTLEAMRDSGKAVLYLVGMKVVNYPRTLQFDVDGDVKFSQIKLSRGRTYQKARVWFTGPDGARWSGFAFGNQRLVCQRMKKQSKNLSPLNPESYIVHYNYE
jgi:hypothetical protein